MDGWGTRSETLVLGSLARNTLLVPDASRDDPRLFHRQEEWVGAPLLREMICQALVEPRNDPTRTAEENAAQRESALEQIRTKVLPEPPPADRGELAESCLRITTVFKQVTRTSEPKDRASVLRVATQYTSPPERPDQKGPSLTEHIEDAVSACRDPGVLVFFDFDDDSARQAVVSSLPRLSDGIRKRFTVIGLAGEIRGKALDWFESLTPAVTGGPDRTVAVVRAEELRKAGLIIIESGPIERTVRDLLSYLDHEVFKTIKARAEHVVILFEELGAVYMRLGRDPDGSIHLSSNSDSIALENGDKYGRTPGRMSITLAAIVRQLAAAVGSAAMPDLSGAIRLSLAAFNRYFSDGYVAADPLSTLESALSYASREQLKALMEPEDNKKPDRRFFISTLAFPMDRSKLELWTRLDAVLPDADEQSRRLRMIVLRGAEAAFRIDPEKTDGLWHPQPRIRCPYMQVGDLKTFDEEEIAGFTSLTKLFRKYLQSPGWKAPLSIAVFGPPGTGKSFGVRELMKSINPAAEKELTFNLSQLTTVESLNDAFRDVQHRVLSSEEVPLVFFDEFDAIFEGTPRGWLRYFLAPMQDGVFRGKATDYRIGRAFFVFAGGTADSFAEFKRVASGDPAAAKAAKLPDFVSRLQGFLDIQSINPPAEAKLDSAQQTLQRQIKRALLLRSLLLTHAKPIVRKQGDEEVPNIDEDLIDAFLNAGGYEHGLRSMESVVRMSKWVDDRFIPASLPARWLLEMHVNGFRV